MSIQVEIKARVPAKDGKPEKNGAIKVAFVDVEGDPKKAMAEAIQMFGEKAILTNAFANWRVTLQSNIRGGLERGETAEQLQARLGSAKMGVAQAGVRAATMTVEQQIAQFATMTPEAQAAFIKQLQAKAAELKK